MGLALLPFAEGQISRILAKPREPVEVEGELHACMVVTLATWCVEPPRSLTFVNRKEYDWIDLLTNFRKDAPTRSFLREGGMEINRIQRKGLADVIGEQLREGILKGDVAPGDRLPPERELATRFGTNRNTLREAIRALEAQGLVRARQGDGVRVQDFKQTGDFGLLPQLVRLAEPGEREFLFGDLLRIRRTICEEAVVLAAERRTPEQVELLRSLIKQQRDAKGDLLTLVTLDVTIYRTLVEASSSLASTLLFNTLERVVSEFVEIFPQIIWFAPDYLDRMSEVVDAISAGDAGRAREVFGDHLRNSDKMLLQRISTG